NSGRNLALADFVWHDGDDAIGAFAVTAGIGVDELVAHFQRDHDDYNSIMTKALADRLAEALAEKLHRDVRRAWYAPDERLSSDYAARKGMTVSEVERWLAPNLHYEPEAVTV